MRRVSEDYRLDKSFWVKTRFDYIVKRTLIDKGIPVLYEPLSLPINGQINGASNHRWLPDFLLDCSEKDKRMVTIETHDFFHYSNEKIMASLKKYDIARKSFGLYVVVISSPRFDSSVITPEIVKDHVDEFWCDKIYTQQKGLKTLRKELNSFLATTELKSASSLDRVIELLRTQSVHTSSVHDS